MWDCEYRLGTDYVGTKAKLSNHAHNKDIHVTKEDKERWDKNASETASIDEIDELFTIK